MKSSNSEVCIIIPVYNEEKVIGSVIKGVLKQFPCVVCVDDGSKDESADEIIKAGAQLVKHPLNLGQGAALQTGLEYATRGYYKYFVTFDADGQHRLEDVKNMLKVIKNEKLDIVLGSRFLGKAENITKPKKFILKLAVAFTNRTSGLKLTDAHNGLRVFNRHVAETLDIQMTDFSHASEITEKIGKKGYAYKEVPVTIVYTDYSKSKGQSIFNAVNIGFDVLLKRLSK